MGSTVSSSPNVSGTQSSSLFLMSLLEVSGVGLHIELLHPSGHRVGGSRVVEEPTDRFNRVVGGLPSLTEGVSEMVEIPLLVVEVRRLRVQLGEGPLLVGLEAIRMGERLEDPASQLHLVGVYQK